MKRHASQSPPASAPPSKAARPIEPPAKALASIFQAPPEPLSISSSIYDRSSTFVGRIYRIRSVSAKDPVLSLIKRSLDASHNMAAWRVLVLKSGKTGLDGPDDFRVESGFADDGEQWGGKRIQGVMEKEGVSDAVVVVSRWYGGVLLGPVRFTHIETCAREVCRFFKAYEEVEEITSQLTLLDEEIADLRAEVASSRPSETENPLDDPGSAPSPEAPIVKMAPSPRQQSYDRLLASSPPDLATAKRLLKAREKTVEVLKAVITKNRLTSADVHADEPSP